MQTSAASGSSSRAGSGTSTPNPSEVYDTYRPLAAQVKRPLSAFLPATALQPSLPTLFDIPPHAYQTRLANKQIYLQSDSSANPADLAGAGPSTSTSTGASALVKGKKRNREDAAARERARREVEESAKERERLGVVGARKAKRLAGGVIKAGERISYTSILPLHHLHTLYLCSLLSLPPLPTNSADDPRSSTTPKHTLPLAPEPLQSKLSKADFTGASLRVISARNDSLNDLRGIVIEETAGTFRLVGEDGIARVIPKNGTLFEVSFPAYAPPTTMASSTDAQVASRTANGPGQKTGSGNEIGSKGNRREARPEPGASGTSSAGQINIHQPEEQEIESEPYTTTLHPYPPHFFANYLAITPRITIPLLGTAFGFRSGDRAGRKFRPAQGGGGGSGWGEEWVKGEWAGVLDLLDDGTPLSSTKRKNGVMADGSSAVATGTGAGVGALSGGLGKRKKGKARRKDPPSWGHFL